MQRRRRWRAQLHPIRLSTGWGSSGGPMPSRAKVESKPRPHCLVCGSPWKVDQLGVAKVGAPFEWSPLRFLLKKESFAFLDGWCSLISSRVTEQQQQQPFFFFLNAAGGGGGRRVGLSLSSFPCFIIPLSLYPSLLVYMHACVYGLQWVVQWWWWVREGGDGRLKREAKERERKRPSSGSSQPRSSVISQFPTETDSLPLLGCSRRFF